jgi:indolepyruvate ferredoxin oxidoreductase
MMNVRRPITLDDKYLLNCGTVLMSGTQALVRLPLAQRRRDELAGLRTAGFISGYRGSPLGGYDRELWRARALLDQHGIIFKPGVNEDLAATAVWGTQQISHFPGTYDGVYSIWYGKGPGVERSGDALKHGNYSGTSKHGGVLVVCGDDHAAKSSSIAHQSEQTLAAHSIPVLYPASVGEIIEYGMAGWAMSRFTGLWVALKCVNETLETDVTVSVDESSSAIQLPESIDEPEGGVNYQASYGPARDDTLVTRYRLPRAKQFARHNRFDRAVFGSASPRIGILTAGKAYADVRYALTLLQLDESRAKSLGLEIYKVGMIWPLEESGLRRFAAGLAEILVVEEKRPFLEQQAASVLYDLAVRPRIIGKRDENGRLLLPSDLPLSATEVAIVIAERLEKAGIADAALRQRSIELKRRLAERPSSAVPDRPTADQLRGGSIRTPYFCSGCPHNTSTRVPEGSKAFAGIGCHTMALRMARETLPPSHMGGEGANWIGIQPFVKTPHIFQNLGDGTYFHSGLMAIRAAVAAASNITYKILYNDVVAMTGGQPIDGTISVPTLAQQVLSEGVKECVVVSDAPDVHRRSAALPKNVTVYSRDDLDQVQQRLREIPGVTVLIYEQMCAAEKRRKIKRGILPQPTRRVFINEQVCEGCGDCSVKSNCVSIRPKETPLGRKRMIDQSTCNEDLSCIKGFCPSFVLVRNARPRVGRALDSTPKSRTFIPAAPSLTYTHHYNVVVAGIGGTGVITIGAVLAMAAHIEGAGAGTYNMTGLAQKGGPVYSHLRFTPTPETVAAARVDVADADLVIVCDLLAALALEALQTIERGRTRAVVNSTVEPSAAFQLFPDSNLPGSAELGQFASALGQDKLSIIDATSFADELTGDTIAANMFMVGYAYQKGLLPVSIESISRAIELNAVAVAFNLRAIDLGRRAAVAQAGSESPTTLVSRRAHQSADDLTTQELVAHHCRHLAEYQDSRYADRYARRVQSIRRTERAKTPGRDGLTRAVARSYARVLAYKDEYEVARLYVSPPFLDSLNQAFEGEARLEVLLAPPTLFGSGSRSVEPRKRAFGPWIFVVFRLLRRLKGLRGTRFDPFGRTAERRMERKVLADYEVLLEEIVATLTPENHQLAVQLAELPENIRGFGQVKWRNFEEAEQLKARLIESFRAMPPASTVGV